MSMNVKDVQYVQYHGGGKIDTWARSKLSTKVVLLAGGIGLSIAAFARPAAAQSYTCPAGTTYDPAYECTTYDSYAYDDHGYYGYLPYGVYGWHHNDWHHDGWDHDGYSFGHGMSGGFGHGGGGGHR